MKYIDFLTIDEKLQLYTKDTKEIISLIENQKLLLSKSYHLDKSSSLKDKKVYSVYNDTIFSGIITSHNRYDDWCYVLMDNLYFTKNTYISDKFISRELIYYNVDRLYEIL